VDWQRLACCKEIIHLFDVPALETNDRDSLVNLIRDLTEGFNIGMLSPGNWQAIKDNLAIHQALAVLFPHEVREDLMEAYDHGTIDDRWIAEKFSIPEDYVELLMSDRWPEYRKALMEI
jgi:hypothetical protein